jgi:4-hydroxybenzoate polyprenyltransferase
MGTITKTIAKYASLVKFTHTVFAMPFALTGYVYALTSTNTPFRWHILVLVILAMVFARNAAMGFTRLVDRKIDAENPRTEMREIPAGKIPPRNVAIFVVVNSLLFVFTTIFINRLSLALSPVALVVILGYSYTKRFTAWSHIVLGMALAIAPVGAYMAVTGSMAIAPIILAALVLTWVAGFDVIYARQDVEYDRTHGLHSIPARFPGWQGLTISVVLHMITLYAVVMFGLFLSLGTLYWIGAGLFCALLALQHILITPSYERNIGLAFGTVNGIASVIFAIFTILEFLL